MSYLGRTTGTIGVSDMIDVGDGRMLLVEATPPASGGSNCMLRFQVIRTDTKGTEAADPTKITTLIFDKSDARSVRLARLSSRTVVLLVGGWYNVCALILSISSSGVVSAGEPLQLVDWSVPVPGVSGQHGAWARYWTRADSLFLDPDGNPVAVLAFESWGKTFPGTPTTMCDGVGFVVFRLGVSGTELTISDTRMSLYPVSERDWIANTGSLSTATIHTQVFYAAESVGTVDLVSSSGLSSRPAAQFDFTLGGSITASPSDHYVIMGAVTNGNPADPGGALPMVLGTGWAEIETEYSGWAGYPTASARLDTTQFSTYLGGRGTLVASAGQTVNLYMGGVDDDFPAAIALLIVKISPFPGAIHFSDWVQTSTGANLFYSSWDPPWEVYLAGAACVSYGNTSAPTFSIGGSPTGPEVEFYGAGHYFRAALLFGEGTSLTLSDPDNQLPYDYDMGIYAADSVGYTPISVQQDAGWWGPTRAVSTQLPPEVLRPYGSTLYSRVQGTTGRSGLSSLELWTP